jgi:YVTN family beta-propeller protein
MAAVTIGSVLAGYRIEAVAGEGGMGRVYRATQMGLKRQVALKLIVPELAGDADFRARFERESHLTASIDHPNVIPVYEAGEADGRLFIAMRWVEGTDLRSLIVSEGSLNPTRAVAIVEQIGEALDAAHSGGLVHRDVKPANVMLTATHGREHAYLTDFGLTKKTASTTALTRAGHFVGTPDYMPPEQIKGERADAHADVYALGCLLFHALTGQPPYDRDTEVAKMYAHLHDPPPSAAETVPGTPVGLDAVITRALAKDPDQRYPSAGDLGRASRAALTGADPSQPERSLATGLAAPRGPEMAPTAPPAGAAPTAPGAAPTAPGAAPTSPPPVPTAPAPTPTEPPPPAAPTPTSGAPPRERPRRLALPIAIAALLVLAAVAAAVLSGNGNKESSGDGSITFSDSAKGPPPKAVAPKAVATIRAGDGPDGIAVDGSTVWVSNSVGNVLTRISTETNRRIGDPITVGTNPDEVEAEDGVVWVANTDSDNVSRLEGGQMTTFTVGAGPEGLSLGKRFLWVANGESNNVSRIDRASGAVLPPIDVGNKPIGIYAGGQFVWVTNSFSSSVSRIDPASGTVVDTIEGVGKNIRAVIERLGSTWVSSVDEDTVTRLDPKSGKVEGDPTKVGDRPKEMVAVGGFVWVVNEGSNSVSRIDPKAGKVVGSPIRVGKKPVGIAVGAGSLWVTNNASDTVTRIDPGG